jgi:hypothetical protein
LIGLIWFRGFRGEDLNVIIEKSGDEILTAATWQGVV